MDATFFDFIEIGTSDFNTLIQSSEDERGLSIEPIKTYLDRLPDKKNVQKLNIAISNKLGTCKVYYMSEEDIVKHNFPDAARGCNSIDSYHKSILRDVLFKKLDPSEIFKYDEVPVKPLFNIYKEHNIG